MNMRQAYLAMAALTLMSFTPAHAVDVRGGCLENTPTGQRMLLDLECRTDDDCWPDPDDVTLFDVARNEDLNIALSDMVWLDANGDILDDIPDGFPVRAVWHMGTYEDGPKKVRLVYDGEAMTADIDLAPSCASLPKSVLDFLR